MTTIDHLEVIAGSVLIAAASVTTIATAVGALTYLLTRERRPASATAPTAVPRDAAPREWAAEAPVAVAG